MAKSNIQETHCRASLANSAFARGLTKGSQPYGSLELTAGVYDGSCNRLALPMRLTTSLTGLACRVVGETDIPAPAMKNAARRAVATLPTNTWTPPRDERRTTDRFEVPADMFDASALISRSIAGARVEQNSDDLHKGNSGDRREMDARRRVPCADDRDRKDRRATAIRHAKTVGRNTDVVLRGRFQQDAAGPEFATRQARRPGRTQSGNLRES